MVVFYLYLAHLLVKSAIQTVNEQLRDGEGAGLARELALLDYVAVKLVAVRVLYLQSVFQLRLPPRRQVFFNQVRQDK